MELFYLTYRANRYLLFFMKYQRKDRRVKKRGFTLVEVMITAVVLSVLVGVAAFIMGDTVNSAKDATRKTNAMTMNKQMSQILALGGTIGDGASNKVDTTSMQTIIDSLTKNLNVEGITFSLDPKPIAEDYELVVENNKKVVRAKLLVKP